MVDLKSMLDLSKNYVPFYWDNDFDVVVGYLNLSAVVSFYHCTDCDDDFLVVFVTNSAAEYFVLVSDVRSSNFSFLADM